MTMRKKKDQKIFQLKVMNITIELKMISARAYHGIINWTEFLEEYSKGVDELQKLFKELGL